MTALQKRNKCDCNMKNKVAAQCSAEAWWKQSDKTWIKYTHLGNTALTSAIYEKNLLFLFFVFFSFTISADPDRPFVTCLSKNTQIKIPFYVPLVRHDVHYISTLNKMPSEKIRINSSDLSMSQTIAGVTQHVPCVVTVVHMWQYLHLYVHDCEQSVSKTVSSSTLCVKMISRKLNRSLNV